MRTLSLTLMILPIISSENPFSIIGKIDGALPSSIELNFNGINNSYNGINYEIKFNNKFYKISCYDYDKNEPHYYAQLEKEIVNNKDVGIKYSFMKGPRYSAIIKIDTNHAEPETENVDLYAKFDDGVKYLSIHSCGNSSESIQRLMIMVCEVNILDKSIEFAKELPNQSLKGRM